MTLGPWNWLEVAKLLASVLTPVSVAGLGWFISRRLKEIEHGQWANQKLIEKRLALYDELAPQLNRLLCFYTWVGGWKEISPEDVIATKRSLDQSMHVNGHILGEAVFARYEEFIKALFQTWTGVGEDAKIRSLVSGPDGDRRRDCSYIWNPAWQARFATNDVATFVDVQREYDCLMSAFRDALGIR